MIKNVKTLCTAAGDWNYILHFGTCNNKASDDLIGLAVTNMVQSCMLFAFETKQQMTNNK